MIESSSPNTLPQASAGTPSAESVVTPDFLRVVAASVQGTSHEKTEQPCQDSLHWGILPHGILVAAVADGAGSAKLSQVGSAVAARIAVETAARHKSHLLLSDDEKVWQTLMANALQAALSAVEEEAAAREVKSRELATTLILVVVTPKLVAVAQVGDGATVIRDQNNSITTLTVPQSGEYINETTFLISPDALKTAQVKIWHGAVAQIAAFTDGLQMLALEMPQGVAHAPFFEPLFEFVSGVTDEKNAREQLIAFLRSPRIRERADDDLTLLLAAFA
ncbi:MAG TPA: PP2C family serine/threonine-protein phosphatase [Abditibacteriaceae bacterium]